MVPLTDWTTVSGTVAEHIHSSEVEGVFLERKDQGSPSGSLSRLLSEPAEGRSLGLQVSVQDTEMHTHT